MKRILLTLMLCWSLLQMQAGTDGILPYAIHQKQLPNGVNVVTVPFGSPGIAAFYIVMRVGSRDEVEAGKTGFAHFFEHMMFRGTDKYSKDKYDEVLKSIGASANANTSLDRTVYHMTGDATKIEKMFELEADRFMNLKYTLQDFKAEAGAVKGEFTKNSASPYNQLEEKTSEVAFEKHTYKHTTMGFFKDVVDMPNQFDYSLSFFQRFYRPENATIVVVGDVKHEDIEALSAKYFGVWKRGAVKASIPTEAEQKETKFAHVEMTNFPPYLSLNYKSPAFDDRKMDMPALDVLSSILFSEKSDLYNQLVVKEQKIYRLNGGAENTRDPYLFNIGVSLKDAKDLQYVKDAITAALEKAKNTPVDEKVLADVKSHLKYGFAMHIDSPDAIAEALSSYIWITGDPESLNRYYALYDKVTTLDIMNAAKKYFVTSGLTIATISEGKEVGVK